MCERLRHSLANDEGPSLENLRTENPDATEPAPSRLPIDRLDARSLLAQTPALPLASVPPGALALGPAAAAEGEFQHAAPRLPP